MTTYYCSIEFERGRWTPINPGGEGFPTYRAAMEEAAGVVHDYLEGSRLGEQGKPDSLPDVKVLLDLGSVDLTSRDDFLAMMAYDPVMKTMFEFARMGGAGGAPRPVAPQRDLLREMLAGGLNGPGAVDHAGNAVAQSVRVGDGSPYAEAPRLLTTQGDEVVEFTDDQLDELTPRWRAPVRTCRVCGCTDEDCSQCIEKMGAPCWWVENDLCSACVPGARSAAAE